MKVCFAGYPLKVIFPSDTYIKIVTNLFSLTNSRLLEQSIQSIIIFPLPDSQDSNASFLSRTYQNYLLRSHCRENKPNVFLTNSFTISGLEIFVIKFILNG